MKYRIQEQYKQTDEIQNTGAIRYFICLFVVFLYSVFPLFVCIVPMFGISSVCLKCSCIRYFICLFVVLLYSVFHLFEYRNTTNKQMKYRIQEHYKQTDEIPNTGTIQTNRWNTEHRSTTNKQMKYRIQEVFLYSVFHLFVCSVPVFGIPSVCL
jgi:hypothetical protein